MRGRGSLNERGARKEEAGSSAASPRFGMKSSFYYLEIPLWHCISLVKRF